MSAARWSNPSRRRWPGGDALTWTRARLFDGVFNTDPDHRQRRHAWPLVLWPTVKFLLIDAVWTGTSRVDCLPETVGREVGACWPFVRAKFTQFMYGFYPASEQWRVNLTYALGAILLVPLLIPRVPYKAAQRDPVLRGLSGRRVLPAGRRRVRAAACGDPPAGAGCW